MRACFTSSLVKKYVTAELARPAITGNQALNRCSKFALPQGDCTKQELQASHTVQGYWRPISIRASKRDFALFLLRALSRDWKAAELKLVSDDGGDFVGRNVPSDILHSPNHKHPGSLVRWLDDPLNILGTASYKFQISIGIFLCSGVCFAIHQQYFRFLAIRN